MQTGCLHGNRQAKFADVCAACKNIISACNDHGTHRWIGNGRTEVRTNCLACCHAHAVDRWVIECNDGNIAVNIVMKVVAGGHGIYREAD